MTEPFRTRRFVAVPASERPHRTRRAVRVVVTDGDAVLLFADTDPGVPGSRWWVTPGGGIDPGESELDAAVRELCEETGLRVGADTLAGPIMRRVVVHGYSDQVLEQEESFYLLRTPRFELDTSGHTPEEQLTLDGHSWHRVRDLASLPEPVWPDCLGRLVALADAPEEWPWRMGEIEESTVAVVDATAPQARKEAR